MKSYCLSIVFVASILPSTSLAKSRLYATQVGLDSQSTLYELSLEDGSANLAAPIDIHTSGFFAAMAYDHQRNVIYATTTDTDSLYTLDPLTGIASLIGPVGIDFPHGLAYDRASGYLYGAYGTFDENKLYRIDPQTAATEFVGDIGMDFGLPDSGNAVSGLDFHPETNILYGAFAGPNEAGALVTIDTQTGDGTLVGLTQRLTAIAFDHETNSLYGVNNLRLGTPSGALYEVDISTAETRLIGFTGLPNPLGLEFLTLIPEPTSVTIALTAAICLVSLRSVRRHDHFAGIEKP